MAAGSAGQPVTPSAEAGPTLVQEVAPSNLAESARAVEGSAEADRRPVSVLSADLSGFTALSECLDPFACGMINSSQP
jgi:class 3 adenylate cyclase